MQAGNRSILKVSDLNSEVASLLRSGFPLLWIEGEISNLSCPSSGHLYFSLKDSRAQVRCAIFRNKSMRLQIKPYNGLKVLARATVGLYEARGDFQLIIEHMEDAGMGQLQLAFEQLKKKLLTIGIFDDQHKQALPKHPKRIGIISSPTGAALHDVVKVLSRRSPHIPLLVYPSLVQGESASRELMTAINQANDDQSCDVLLLVRGGGSAEDLWAFNDENLAHVIFNSTIPIVSGIGHEVDFTIADFVSDQRAPTPSVAAEIASPNREEQIARITKLEQQLSSIVNNKINDQARKLSYLHKRLQQHAGFPLIQQYAQSIDHWETRLLSSLKVKIEQQKHRQQQLKQRLLNLSPIKMRQEQQTKLSKLKMRLEHSMNTSLLTAQNRLNKTMQLLDAVSPLATMQRGYSIVRNSKGVVIHAIKQVRKGQNINILLNEGELHCTINKKSTP